MGKKFQITEHEMNLFVALYRLRVWPRSMVLHVERDIEQLYDPLGASFKYVDHGVYCYSVEIL